MKSLFILAVCLFSLPTYAETVSFRAETVIDSHLLEAYLGNPNVETVEMAPYDLSGTAEKYNEFEGVSDDELLSEYGSIKINQQHRNGTKDYKYVAFLWGYLEQSHFNIEYREVSKVVHIFRKAGFGVHIDKFVTKNDAKKEFSDDRNVAIWWSSHGSSSGEFTVEVDAYTYERWNPNTIPKKNYGTKMVYLCSCYSIAASNAITQKLKNATVWGFSGTVTVKSCAKGVSGDFIKKFNQSI